jgi:hypothetical protein
MSLEHEAVASKPNQILLRGPERARGLAQTLSRGDETRSELERPWQSS